jgi:glutamate-1-semialdehyde 2,1-aminomutase/spore coat polysaccharide biosynthesis protein SpsF
MGNGFPISCVVGRRDVMKVFETIFFSGTLAVKSHPWRRL